MMLWVILKIKVMIVVVYRSQKNLKNINVLWVYCKTWQTQYAYHQLPSNWCWKSFLYGTQSGELRSCIKVKVAILGSSSLISLTVSVDIQQHWERNFMRAQELCQSQGGCPELPVPDSLYSLYGRKATLNWNWTVHCVVLYYLVL